MSSSALGASAQLLKTSCRYLCEGSRSITTPPITEDWAQHPGLNLALDGLSAYANWVSRVVMPIVFQWVDEHKSEVYEKVPRPLFDDVGVVVAAAFDIVKQKNAYKGGKEAFAEFQEELAADTWHAEKVNPTWTEISRNLRTEVRGALERASKPLEMAKSA
jgi:hypothetical protein